MKIALTFLCDFSVIKMQSSSSVRRNDLELFHSELTEGQVLVDNDLTNLKAKLLAISASCDRGFAANSI